MTTKLTYEEYKEAYKTARHQYRNHQDMVSGAWGISGREFCEQYDLNYEQARDYEIGQLDKDFDDCYIIEKRRIVKQVGELTPAQEDHLMEQLERSFDWEEEQAYFWYDLATDQLANAYPEYNNRYYDDKDFK